MNMFSVSEEGVYFKEVIYRILKIRGKLKEWFRHKIFMYSKQQSITNVGPTAAQTASRPTPCICGVKRHQRISRVRTLIAITLNTSLLCQLRCSFHEKELQ